jgi:ABC-type transport system, involved in lipoprotein release, permease component
MMKNGAMKFYIKRKLGSGQKAGYVLSAYLPSLLVFIVFALLVFITVFVNSMGLRTEEIIECLGSSSILTYERPEADLLPSGTEVFDVRLSQGLAYGEDETLLLEVKGVEAEYFTGRRAPYMNLEGTLEEGRSIVLSSYEAGKLNVEIGDKVVVALYESAKGRVRPVYCTVSGLFETGYGEFDSSVSYVPLSLLEEGECHELLLPEGSDAEKVALSLEEAGFYARDYKTLYASLLDNVLLSVRLISLIVFLLSVAAGFFALNIAAEYTSRDANEIRTLYILGYTRREVMKTYRNLSLFVTMISALAGGVLGLLFSFGAVGILSSLSPAKYPVLLNYATNLSLHIPVLRLLALYFSLFAVSLFSLSVSLRGLKKGRNIA